LLLTANLQNSASNQYVLPLLDGCILDHSLPLASWYVDMALWVAAASCKYVTGRSMAIGVG
jgi:hypothetical protein